MEEEKAKGLEKVDGIFKRSGLHFLDNGEPSRIQNTGRGAIPPLFLLLMFQWFCPDLLIL